MEKGKNDKANLIVRPSYGAWSAHGGLSWLDDATLHYGSQIYEHHVVRQDVSVFDASHITIVDLHVACTCEFICYLLANDIAKLTQPGKALYTGMLNDSGSMIDDLIIYFLAEDYFCLVVNSATREKDLSWIEAHAVPYSVSPDGA